MVRNCKCSNKCRARAPRAEAAKGSKNSRERAPPERRPRWVKQWERNNKRKVHKWVCKANKHGVRSYEVWKLVRHEILKKSSDGHQLIVRQAWTKVTVHSYT